MYVGVCLVCLCFVSVGNLMLCPKKNKTNECHGESTTGDERNNLNFTQLDFDEPQAATDSGQGSSETRFSVSLWHTLPLYPSKNVCCLCVGVWF